MSEGDDEINTRGLDAILKALKNAPPVAKIGILGTTAAREGGGENNATIGMRHELGMGNLPVRSFLRMPIATQLDKALEKSGAFTKEAALEMIAAGSILPWLKKAAVVAEGVVLESFDTGGYGTWVPSNMTRKKNHTTLIETGQLRNAITHEVREGA